jgi:hypothetical protein
VPERLMARPRSRPLSLSSIRVPSSGQLPASREATRPHFGHCHALRSVPSRTGGTSTPPVRTRLRASAPSRPRRRPFRPASSRQRSTASVLLARVQRSRTGRATSRSSVGVACACAWVHPARRGEPRSRGDPATRRASPPSTRSRPGGPRGAVPAVELVGNLRRWSWTSDSMWRCILRLRPAALVVPPGVSSEWSASGRAGRWCSRYSSPCSRPTRATSAPSPSADERDERREVEAPADLDPVGNAIGQSERKPESCPRPAQKTATPCAPSRLNSTGQIVLAPLEVGLQPLARRRGSRCGGLLMPAWSSRERTRTGLHPRSACRSDRDRRRD